MLVALQPIMLHEVVPLWSMLAKFIQVCAVQGTYLSDFFHFGPR